MTSHDILRLLDKVAEPATGVDCWVWSAAKNKDGYGNFYDIDRVRSAHRVSYELYIGEIPSGKELDHICRKRACVNPWHLVPVTHQENCRLGKVGKWYRGDACKKGHYFDADNTYLWMGHRYCKKCRKTRQRKASAKRVHAVIPDAQVRPDVDYTHMRWVGNYLAEKQPDVIVDLGDHADMPSLSSYDVGKASAEGARYAEDIACSKSAMDMLLRPIRKQKRYSPKLVLTLGNHEHRIDREAESNPRWKGFLSSADLGYAEAGWKVIPYLRVVRLDDIDYAHFFVSGAMGRPVSSAAALLRIRQRSAIQGHIQRIDMAVHPNTQNIALFAGICYQHDEGYLTPQGNNTKRGIWMLHEVREGTFDPMFVSLGFLKRRYS